MIEGTLEKINRHGPRVIYIFLLTLYTKAVFSSGIEICLFYKSCAKKSHAVNKYLL